MYTPDPKESKQIDSEDDLFPNQKDDINYPDQFNESEDFIEEDEL